MPSGDRAGARRDAVLELEHPEPDVDLAEAVRSGVQAVHILAPQVLSRDRPEAALALVRVLREAAADGIPIMWRGDVGDGVDVAALVHLPPPAAPEHGGVDALGPWRDRYQPGLCYYRLGPGFAFVKDVRDPAASARFRVGLADAPDALEHLEAVATTAHLDTATRAVLADLEEERLVLRLGELVTLLPYRMRRWPVPSLDV